MTLTEQVKEIFRLCDQIESEKIVIAFIIGTLETLGPDAQERVRTAMKHALID